MSIMRMIENLEQMVSMAKICQRFVMNSKRWKKGVPGKVAILMKVAELGNGEFGKGVAKFQIR